HGVITVSSLRNGGTAAIAVLQDYSIIVDAHNLRNLGRMVPSGLLDRGLRIHYIILHYACPVNGARLFYAGHAQLTASLQNRCFLSGHISLLGYISDNIY